MLKEPFPFFLLRQTITPASAKTEAVVPSWFIGTSLDSPSLGRMLHWMLDRSPERCSGNVKVIIDTFSADNND